MCKALHAVQRWIGQAATSWSQSRSIPWSKGAHPSSILPTTPSGGKTGKDGFDFRLVNYRCVMRPPPARGISAGLYFTDPSDLLGRAGFCNPWIEQ